METTPTYQVAYVATPPTQLLDLVALHAELLPLAREAGHERLSLSQHYAGDAHQAHYEACAAGGASGYRSYINWLAPGDADRAPHFARVLAEKLREQAGYLALVNKQVCTHPALADTAA